MAMFLVLVVCVVVLQCQHGAQGDSAMCYDCSRIPYPRDCDRVVRCPSDSLCYTDEYVTDSGTILYDTGCRSNTRCAHSRRDATRTGSDVGMLITDADDDTVLCEMCCDGDFCNSHGCHTQPLLPVGSRGPVCFNCHQQRDEDSCFIITVCDLHEQCQLQSTTTGNGDILYTTGCTTPSICERDLSVDVAVVGRRRLQQQPQCGGCCSGDYCNRNCSVVHYGMTGKPPPTTEVTSPATTTQHSTVPSTRTTVVTSSATTTQSSTIRTSDVTSPVTITQSSTVPTTSTTVVHVTSPVTTTQSSTSPTTQTTTAAYWSTWSEWTCSTDDVLNACFQSRLRTCSTGLDDDCSGGQRSELQVCDGTICSVPSSMSTTTPTTSQTTPLTTVSTTSQTTPTASPTTSSTTSQTTSTASPTTSSTTSQITSTASPTTSSTKSSPRTSIPVTQATHPATMSPEEQCHDIDYDYDATYHVCYSIQHGFKLTWREARSDCQEDDADLIIFRSAEEEQQFVAYAKDIARFDINYWVGASDIHQENHWAWIDGSHVNRSLFQDHQPDNHRDPTYGDENCAALNRPSVGNRNDIRLNDGPCDKPEYFICELKLTDQQTGVTSGPTSGPTNGPASGSCRNSDYVFNPDTGICFKIYNTTPKTQASARQQCHDDDAELLILRNRTVESEFINMHFNDHDMNHRYFIGGYRISGQNVPASFRWYNGRELDPSLHWYPGEPNNQFSGENCLTFTYFTGSGGFFWPFRPGRGAEFALNDDNCNHPYYFICEEKCPNQAYHYDSSTGLCYKLYTDQVTWSDARRRCEQEHMDLLELTNQAQLDYFQTILKDNESYWVGATTTTASPDSFEWLTLKQGIPTSFWQSGMTSSGTRHCVALSHSPLDNKVAMSRQECDTTTNVHGFICQHIW